MENNGQRNINSLWNSFLLSTGAFLQDLGVSFSDSAMRRRRTMIENLGEYPRGLEETIKFPLIEALYGRRARRFSLGAEIPDGPLKFKSFKAPVPLDALEQMLLLNSCAGNTGWHSMIHRAEKYAPHLANYSAASGGRTFPSAAGFHTSEFFYTDDFGVYFLPTRDAPSLVSYDDDRFNLKYWLEVHAARKIRLSDKRLYIPNAEPYMEPHNTWCVNKPGSTLIIPVADIAQHMLALLCFAVQNGYCIFDNIKGRSIPGLDKFSNLVNLNNPYPLTFVEQYALTEATAELSASCYAGMLMLQAMGLGGWMFDGIDRFSILGASGNPEVPGLGFSFNKNPKYPLPDITGLPGVFEGFCPPHFKTMEEATRALVKRKFGVGGPYHKDTDGPWKESSRIRSSAQMHSEEFIACVSTMAQYIYDTYERFPGTVPSIFCLTYLQAHHLDLDFYDHYYKEGAYLKTHKHHMEWWRH
jgi:hypothetical protein